MFDPFSLTCQHSLWIPLIKIVTMSMSYTLRTPKGIVTYERNISYTDMDSLFRTLIVCTMIVRIWLSMSAKTEPDYSDSNCQILDKQFI